MSNYIKDLELKPEHLETFRTLAKEWVGRKAQIALIIAQIDPDGLACAKLLKAALEHLNVEVAGIFYAGTVGHRQNQKIFDQFNLGADMAPIAEMPEGCLQFLVDSSKISDTRLLQTKFKPDDLVGYVDHHHTNGKMPEDSRHKRFMWNAPVAAAATLGWTLVRQLETPVDELLATLAAIGIYTDSNRLASEFTTKQDIAAYSAAMQKGDVELFARCCNFRLTQRNQAILEEILHNVEHIGPYQISHPNCHLPEEDGDDISLYADHMAKYEGPHTTVVWGYCGDEIRYSIRTTGEGGNVLDLLHKLFSKGTGGTKQGAGGGRFRIQEQFVPSDESSEEFIAFFRVHLRQKLAKFARISDEDDTKTS